MGREGLLTGIGRLYNSQ